MEIIVMYLCIVGLLLTWLVIKQHWKINRLEIQRSDILKEQREVKEWLLFVLKEQELELLEIEKTGDPIPSLRLNHYLESTCISFKPYLQHHDIDLSRDLLEKYQNKFNSNRKGV
ncbi:hypothetical protein JZO82_04120 [Vagococcus fluvialis]|uniref:hypothetical protein n=1 Tax=Vagococcus fluvialis TaxID=2738 RepID=UPI001A8D77F7|nr:hypothetical protein [Vagococcus fluvialis]MBO0428342.1 hypothetical protein [Vagococcus fluvialis]